MDFFLNYSILKINFCYSLIRLLPRTLNTVVARGRDIVITIVHFYLYIFLNFLNKNTFCLFKVLCDMTAVDWPVRVHRFDVVYNLLSIQYNSRIRIKTVIGQGSPIISACLTYSNANWFEREIWDLFGILFYFHPNMCRILTDYGFIGHALRKDFPVVGFFDVSYSLKTHSVIRENINNINDKKNFVCDTPWLVNF
uniref:NADH dehydrogenase subunit 9 n=1 Tax=Proteromonas lacertae TaxID=42746 RepID=E2E9Y6_PROLC|nr:NADH dehydrogenase subunit 9 [Proteromonas lacertae]YP_003795241.1 NADH dehydrogenase subunit 9 [Proteromonas lacertae]ADD46341.1 NADH dehydrogenase subunit 9 [Proteromonas lacertae]ADD46379.1 NADH dehydrogenase subunit 9 [Proteromonas lacertae]